MSSPATSEADTAQRSPARRRSAFRADIQGLRAVAVLLVVIYHIWPARLSGGYVGVDVFFVISGYLMTQMLLRWPPRTRADFADFWARRIRRLIPAALFVTIATIIATVLVAPATIWSMVAKQAIACTLYVQNWLLAQTSVDYLAQDDAPSPLLHYWSLSVEEQFYLLWPVLIGVAAWAARRWRQRSRVWIAGAVIAMFVISLIVSYAYTDVAPSQAYFVTPTRIWELALGGVVAVAPALRHRPGGRWQAAVPWIGLGAIVVAGVGYDDSTAFPGIAALLPTLGAALVIWSEPRPRSALGRALGTRPVQYLGDTSYSIYLWHWPLLVLLPYVSGTMGVLDRATVFVGSIVLAGVTKVLLEDPVRRLRSPGARLPTYQWGVGAMVIVCLAAAAWWNHTDTQVQTAKVAAHMGVSTGPPVTGNAMASGVTGVCFGAAAIASGFDVCPPDPDVDPIPAPIAAEEDKSVAYADNCWAYSDDNFARRPVCTYGSGPVQVALVGNSHAGHWLPALQRIADQRGWTITTYLVSRCAPSFTRQEFDTDAQSDGCYDYGQWVLDQTTSTKFDLIITSNRKSVESAGKDWDSGESDAVAGFARYLETWRDAGLPVIVIKDLPWPGMTIDNVPDCLAEHVGDVEACAGTPSSWTWHYPYAQAAEQVSDVHVIDMWHYFCTDTTCPTVIGGVTVYFDSSHMTATYARSLAPYLEAKIDQTGAVT